ncbi:MAG: TA system antitoxin ParD family protein [Acidimicrobiales bacterium]
MTTTSPTRIEDELYASAKLAGEAQSRSASQQLAHWARIGREIQASAGISHREIAQVLAGRRSYDGLDPKEQAVVRAEWAERMATYRQELDLADQFSTAGRRWVELDGHGEVVRHDDHGEVVELDRPAAKSSKRGTAPRRTARSPSGG